MSSWKNRSGRAEPERMPISLANFIPKCSLEQGNWGDRKSGDFLGEVGLSWLTRPSRHFPRLRSTPFLTLEFYLLGFLWHSPLISGIKAPPTVSPPSPQHTRPTQMSSLSNKQTKFLSLPLISSCLGFWGIEDVLYCNTTQKSFTDGYGHGFIMN